MSIRRTLSATTALAIAGAVVALPSSAQADVTIGFSTTSTATPVRIEIYEPTIPIPAEPQAEFNLAYTTVETSGSPTSGQNAHGRASWLWPGDPVGEGLKTFGDTIIPAELGLAALYENGYPVQSNSYYPGDPNTESDERFPGAVQSTTSGEDKSVAKVGYSPDGDVPDGDSTSEGGGSGLPLPLVGDLGSLSSTLGLTSARQGSTAEGPLPPELAAIIDFGGSSSVSRATFSEGTITSYASSRMHDVSLLAGLITMDSVNVTTTVESTLKGAKPKVEAHFVGLSVAGNEFKVTKDGVVAVGNSTPALDLPADPGQALAELGVTFAMPTAEQAVKDGSGSIAVQGLRVQIDVTKLHAYLDQLPLNALADAIPEVPGWPEEAPQLKSVVQALVNAKPRIVLFLGNASASAAAVPPIDVDLCELGLMDCDDDDGGPGPGPGPTGGNDTTGPIAGPEVPIDGGPTTTPPVVPGIDTAAAGLPPLKSIPALLVLVGLVVASGMGWWLQRIGSSMLGIAGACAHGAETGIPDLRKV